MSNMFDQDKTAGAGNNGKTGGETPQGRARARRASFNTGDNQGGQANLRKHMEEIFQNVAGDIKDLTLYSIEGKDIGRSVSENYFAMAYKMGSELFVHPMIITSPTRQLMTTKTISEGGEDRTKVESYIEVVKHGVKEGTTVLNDIVDFVAKDKGMKAIMAYYYISLPEVAKRLYAEELTAQMQSTIRGILNNAQNALFITADADDDFSYVVGNAQLEARYTFQPERILELSDGTPVRADYTATLKAVERNVADDVTKDNASESLLARLYSYVTARYIGPTDDNYDDKRADRGQFLPLLNVNIDLESADLKEGAVIQRGLAALSLVSAQLSNGRWMLQYTPDTIPADCRISNFYYGFDPDTVAKLPSEVALDKLEKSGEDINAFIGDRVWRDGNLVDVAITVNDHRMGSSFSQLFLDIDAGVPGAREQLIDALHSSYTDNGRRREEVVKKVQGILSQMMEDPIVVAANTAITGLVGAGSKRPSSVVDPLYVFSKLGRNYLDLIDDYLDITSFDGCSLSENVQDVKLLEIMNKVTNDCFEAEGYEHKLVVTGSFIAMLDQLNQVTGRVPQTNYDYQGAVPNRTRRGGSALSGHRADRAGGRDARYSRQGRSASHDRYRTR